MGSTLKKIPGVRKIRTDWGNQLITVSYDDERTTPDVIEKAIFKAGHIVTGQE